MSNRPLLGITPRHIWIERRLEEVREAIGKRVHGSWPVPVEWIEEYNELIKSVRIEGLGVKNENV